MKSFKKKEPTGFIKHFRTHEIKLPQNEENWVEINQENCTYKMIFKENEIQMIKETIAEAQKLEELDFPEQETNLRIIAENEESKLEQSDLLELPFYQQVKTSCQLLPHFLSNFIIFKITYESCKINS